MEFRKITPDNVWKIVKVRVAPEQEDFVASNGESLIEAFAAREAGFVALPFGIYEGETPVGFFMLGYGRIGDEEEPSVAEGNYCLWRFLIGAEFQGKGYGRRALEMILDYIRTFPVGKADAVWLSYEPENTRAKALYASFGFEENGETDGNELVAVLKL